MRVDKGVRMQVNEPRTHELAADIDNPGCVGRWNVRRKRGNLTLADGQVRFLMARPTWINDFSTF